MQLRKFHISLNFLAIFSIFLVSLKPEMIIFNFLTGLIYYGLWWGYRCGEYGQVVGNITWGKTNKVFLKRSGLTGPEAVTSQAMTCLQDNKKGSKLRPTPFTTLDEDAYYGDNIAGNCKYGL